MNIARYLTLGEEDCYISFTIVKRWLTTWINGRCFGHKHQTHRDQTMNNIEGGWELSWCNTVYCLSLWRSQWSNVGKPQSTCYSRIMFKSRSNYKSTVIPRIKLFYIIAFLKKYNYAPTTFSGIPSSSLTFQTHKKSKINAPLTNRKLWFNFFTLK